MFGSIEKLARRPLAVVLAVLAPAMLGTCGRDKDRDKPSSGLDSKLPRVTLLLDHSGDVQRIRQVALLEALLRGKARLDVAGMQAVGDTEAQVRQVKAATQSGARAIFIFPRDPAALAPVLREALQAGVQVYAFSPQVPEDACTTLISLDDTQVGAIAGRHVVAELRKRADAAGSPALTGRIVMLRGDETSASCERQAQGFMQEIAAHPGIVLVHDAPCEWSETSAMERTREALRIQKQFDVVYSQSDEIARGATRALAEVSPELRGRILVIGTGGAPGDGGGIEMVRSGKLDATIYLPPLVDIAWTQLEPRLGESASPPRKQIRVQPVLITRETVSRFKPGEPPLPVTD